MRIGRVEFDPEGALMTQVLDRRYREHEEEMKTHTRRMRVYRGESPEGQLLDQGPLLAKRSPSSALEI